MRVPRVFLQQSLGNQNTLVLAPEASHYLCKVLRMAEGRELVAFDGSGEECRAIILKADKRATEISIIERQLIDRESPLHTHLAIGISRGDRMEWVMQKATELGASEITPIFTERSEVKLMGDRLTKKLTQWTHIAISACEQSQRNTLPKIHPPCSLADLLQSADADLKLVLHHRSNQSITDGRQRPNSVCLLIGPEGGLSEQELDLSLQHGFDPLTLGPRVLRTETAPISALTAVQLLWGDLGNHSDKTGKP